MIPLARVLRTLTPPPVSPPADPRLDPHDGDAIDELVNESLQRGKVDRR